MPSYGIESQENDIIDKILSAFSLTNFNHTNINILENFKNLTPTLFTTYEETETVSIEYSHTLSVRTRTNIWQ